MDEFPGLLTRDFGFRPQGKSAPMAASKGAGGLNFGVGSGSDARSSTMSSSINGKPGWNSGSFMDDHDGLFGSIGNQRSKDRGGLGGYDDVFGGPPKYASAADGRNGPPPGSSFDYDSIFRGSKDSAAKSSSLPVFDKPVYDDDGGDLFNGVPGLKSSASVKHDDVFSFASSSKQSGRYDDLLGKMGRMDPELRSSSRKKSAEVPKHDASYDDLLGNLGKVEPESKSSSGRSGGVEKDMSGFDDLIPGFGGSSPSNNRVPSETSQPHYSTVPSSKSTSSVIEDPFVVLESNSAAAYASSRQFTEPMDEVDKSSKSASVKVDVSSASGVFDDMNPLAGLTKSAPSVSSDMKNRDKNRSPLRTNLNLENLHKYAGRGSTDAPSGRMTENTSQKSTPFDNYHKSHQTLFDVAPVSSDSHRPFSQNGSLPSYAKVSPNQTTSHVDMPPKSEDCFGTANDVWLAVSEVPLFTEPTSAPPPSRPPPPRPVKVSRTAKGSFSAANSKKVDEFSSFQHPSQNFQSPKTVPDSSRSSGVSPIEELEDFSMGRSQNNASELGDGSSEEEVDTNSAAAAMKDAMDRAEAKFKYAKEVRDRENAKGAKTRGAAHQEKDEKVMQDAQEQELREQQDRIDREREQREREEKEIEQRKLEKERERAREHEREREKARQAVERATREARERAAAEARLKAERAVVEKATAAARERAERAAVQRAQSEARERAAAEAKQRAEKAATEARERAQAEAREKSASATKSEAEERLKAELAAAAARMNRQKNDNDIESFFSMGAQPNSAPRSRTSSDPAFDAQFHNRPGPEGTNRSSTGTSSSMKKASSTTNIVDDLSSIFGATPSSGEFQEIEGESEERRRGRLMRHQKAQERAAKALAEKNERDLQAQRDQAERNRMAETLDAEIKRWAAGKEGNLRALLSTLQYVLWPECGWQPVSLTDLITAVSVKKVYRKATLCIHPDKVQQKGANLQQKYIAEKVFDLLKEAWNKFNSEELF